MAPSRRPWSHLCSNDMPVQVLKAPGGRYLGATSHQVPGLSEWVMMGNLVIVIESYLN